MTSDFLFISRGLLDNARYWCRGSWRRTRRQPVAAGDVPQDFIGICVASAPDPASDDYLIARLKELGLKQVRLDFSYASRGAHGERLLKRLLDESLRVCLHLVQPLAEVRALPAITAQQRWQTFVAETLAAYGSRLEMVEIGSTCNRRRWSGYTPHKFMLSWQLAWTAARAQNVKLAGPNVTDFEPPYNIAILAALQRRGCLPAIHTNNLFVERAGEPEAFDHKILGRSLAGLLGCNLVRKAQLLKDIGLWAGVPKTICSHVTWSLRRIARQLELVEEKQADYLARYICLAAAAGALERVYWGPLIGQREGLIDDGTSAYPDIPHVTYYGLSHGHPDSYRIRPAFHALQTCQRWLAGARFQRKIPTGSGLEIMEFSLAPEAAATRSGARLHVAWTTNGYSAETAACYAPELLDTLQAYTRSGQRLERVPAMINESPLYLILPAGTDGGAAPRPGIIPQARWAALPGTSYARLRHTEWDGFYLAQNAQQPFTPEPLLAVALEAAPAGRALPGTAVLLRDSRNRVWSIPAPQERNSRLIIKQFKPRGFWRRLLQRHQPNRAQRSWNGAQELLRRGLPTPQPRAFIYHQRQPRQMPSFYICRSFDNAWSLREACNAFRSGAVDFQGKAFTELFKELAAFLHKMHERGVFYRDLSAGNLLFRCAAESEIEFSLIDTARARFYPRPTSLPRRLSDLMRICHPLPWRGRQELLKIYMQLQERPLRLWMKIPFVYYDAKHLLKNGLKKLRGRAR